MPRREVTVWAHPLARAFKPGQVQINIRVIRTSNLSITDTSDNFFIVIGPSPPGITASSPNGGQTWPRALRKRLHGHMSATRYLRIELLKAGTVVATLILLYQREATVCGSYNWTTPSSRAASFRLQGKNYQHFQLFRYRQS